MDNPSIPFDNEEHWHDGQYDDARMVDEALAIGKAYRKMIHDSGERRSFDTGSQRDTARGKGRFDLISPIALKRIAQHYEAGAAKYDARNWEKGQPVSVYLDCLLRHVNNYRIGHRDEDHLAAAAWNAIAAIHTLDQVSRGNLPVELDDLPDYLGEGDDGLGN